MKYKNSFIVILGFLILIGNTIPSIAKTFTLHMDKTSAKITAGDWVSFHAILNNNTETTPENLVAHLNIAALIKGQYVDPEDWSTKRTQYLSAIQPGQTVKIPWKVHALIEGKFAVFVTLISDNPSFTNIVSQPLLIQVTPDKILPLNEVIPIIVLIPFLSLMLLIAIYNFRKST